MATLYPRDPPATGPSSELKVRRALDALGPDWHIFHSVAWQAPRAGRQGDGEADFVLLHPGSGLLVLEVKGGRIEVAAGEWYTVDRNGERHRIKDPFRQATDSKHALLRYLRDVRSLPGIPAIHHAVVFPDVTLTEGIGLHPRAIIIDGADLADPNASIARVLRHWGPPGAAMSPAAVHVVVDLLAPTVTASGVLRSGIVQAERQILNLTKRQIETLSMLRTVRRCVIRGGAGTGKTLLAVEKARRLSLEGARTLLVCFNAPLANHVASILSGVPAVTVATFHSLVVRVARSAKQELPARPDDDWFATQSSDVLANAAAVLGEQEKFDALIVDEAQDFSDDWLTALMLLLMRPDEDPLVLFLDSHQQIYRSALTLPAGWPVVELDRNCRNTLQIARAVSGCFGDPRPEDGASGPDVSFIEADDSLILEVVHDVVRRLLADEGLAPDQIVALTNTRHVATRLRTMLVGPAAFVELGRDGVVAETIHRYKGLEAEAVVLALSGKPESTANDVDRALAYVGLSRARSALFVVGTRKWIQWCKALAAS